MSLYVAVHSDASRKTFTDNTAAKFTTRLSKPIILNSEYNVAVSSIIKYWRDGISEPFSGVKNEKCWGHRSYHRRFSCPTLRYYTTNISRISNVGGDQETAK